MDILLHPTLLCQRTQGQLPESGFLITSITSWVSLSSCLWEHIGEVYPLLWNITKLDVICTLPKNPSPTYLLETEEKYVTLEHLVPLSRILQILRNETPPCLYVCKSPWKEFTYKQIESCTTDRKIYASDKCSKAVPLTSTLIMRLFVYRPMFTTSQYGGALFPTYCLF